MEILKQNVPQGAREHFFSWSSAFNFFGGVLIGVPLSLWLEAYHGNWTLLIVICSAIGLLSVFIQAGVPIMPKVKEEPSKRNALIAPWKDSWNLLRERPDFAKFQIGFMFGGVGLMLIMPALVIYTADDLVLSNFDMTMSRFVWMGLGFVMATPFWRKNIGLQGIYKKTAIVCLFFASSAFCWILATVGLSWFYVAYFLYGIAQAGSHLIWHLSGPLFAGSGNSSLFSTVNILTVGLRGLIVPFMASLLCVLVGPLPVIALGLIGCLAGAVYLFAQRDLNETQHAANTAT
jgi:MFS family permease